MKVYLDNCSFNRPFDDQSQFRIRLETEAKLFIQHRIHEGFLKLAWSYILEYENQANPFDERREAIQAWKNYSVIDTDESQLILARAKEFTKKGLKNKDALHVACAIEMGCDYFITTDDRLLNKMKDSQEIVVLSPITFISEVES